MKRGPKRWEEERRGTMPMRLIAARMGVCHRTVWNLYRSAIEKLKRDPGAVEGLLECVQAVGASKSEILEARSVECRKRFIERYGQGDL